VEVSDGRGGGGKKEGFGSLGWWQEVLKNPRVKGEEEERSDPLNDGTRMNTKDHNRWIEWKGGEA